MEQEMQGISTKLLMVMAGIVVVLILIATFPLWRSYVGLGEKNKSNNEITFSSYSKDTVTEFVVKKGTEVLQFKKEGTVWKLNGVDVTEGKVVSFLEALNGITVMEIASKNSENHRNLGFTDEEEYELTVTVPGAVKDFLVGAEGTQMNTFYLKERESQTAYLVKGNLYSFLGQTQETWLKADEQ